MFRRVLALALNPSVDLTLWVDTFVPHCENQVQEERHEAAGKAVNVARALQAYGVPCRCIMLAGKENRPQLEARLQQEGLDYRLVEVAGYTKENITIVHGDGRATRLLRQGFSVPYEALEEIQNMLASEVTQGTLVVISGQMPKGVTPRLLQNLCQTIVQAGGQVALDSASVSQEDLEQIRPWAIKPNRKELCLYAGRDLTSKEEMVAYAQSLNAKGIEHCLVSLDREGLLYTGEGEALWIEVPEVSLVSQVGSGDNCLAGFIAGMNQGFSVEKSVCTAAAMGTASCLREGASPATKIATANILLQLQCHHLV